MVSISRWRITLVILSLVFGLLFALPNALPKDVRESLPGFMPKQVMNLGLDLQGGSYLLLEVDTEALRVERLNNMVEDVRSVLREEDINSEIGVVNGGVNVRITDPTKVQAATKVLREDIGAPMAGMGGGRDVTVQTQSGGQLRLAFVPDALQAESARAVEQSIEIIRRRIDELGTREPTIQRQGTNRIVVAAAGESDPQRLKAVLGKTAKLTFHLVDEGVTPEEIMAGRIPPGRMLISGETPGDPPIVVDRRSMVTGEMLTGATAGFDQLNGQPNVSLRFNGLGTRRFGEATTRNVKKRFAIVLDNKYISAPVINEPITGGNAQISGSMDTQAANDLALVLRAGALPTRLNVEEERTVGAGLGADAVAAGKISAIGAFVLVLLFMVVAYGWLFGGVSILALLVNGLLIVGAMSMTQATLTLPGIAGLILTLAVAVDANVLIYERMREEYRAGRSLVTAMDAGFNRAMLTIFDANITHLGAALIMFSLGAGPVKGFAWTLAIGVFTSVFTAVLVTQVLLAFWLKVARPKILPIERVAS